MDEDLEFRDMVLKKLEENGSLIDIKAKLRAHLYKIIEMEPHGADSTIESDITSSMLEKESDLQPDAKSLAMEIVLEMLESLNLQYTKEVFMSESGHRRSSMSQKQLRRHIGLKACDTESTGSQPLLVSLVEEFRGDGTKYSIDADTTTESKVCSSSKLNDVDDTTSVSINK